MKNKRSASAALVGMLVVALVTLIMALAFAENSISTVEIQVQSQEGTRSYYLAESCLEEAILRLEDDIDFTSATLSFDASRMCSITVTGSNPKTISIVTTVDQITENYEAQASYTAAGTVNNFGLSSWQEVP